MTDDHLELSESENKTAKTEIPSQNAILEEAPPGENIDRHSTALENVSADTDPPQLLSQSIPVLAKPHGRQVESSAADKMTLTLPCNDLVAASSPPRSKVLLVEDNIINMKVCNFFFTHSSSKLIHNVLRSSSIT